MAPYCCYRRVDKLSWQLCGWCMHPCGGMCPCLQAQGLPCWLQEGALPTCGLRGNSTCCWLVAIARGGPNLCLLLCCGCD
jgi:hypothetical protein